MLCTTRLKNSPYVDKKVIIVTDKPSNCGLNATKAANDLKAATFGRSVGTVQVYGLIIGPFTLQGQAEVKQYVFPLRTYTCLNNLALAI
ncbi:hypothetical protein CHS0354_016690 [Potamilus streckersoni]|uniref:Uncharacterized protein n=1 Tax=Potamilus streckersoni TaxID=2493646 RepID=A0AAE0VQ88_9BIVA|nr:hypothetical protein CHS0354_016690 [Potamilus streckersoni]